MALRQACGQMRVVRNRDGIIVRHLKALEICAGAGGQALGLEQAGFSHALAVELDSWAAKTLRANLGDEVVREGDVADRSVWDPAEYADQIDLVAGGVPCPPFSIAGRQRGANDERDLFAWAVELAGVVHPRALLLENVRGLSAPRFAAYRQHVLDRLEQLGYVADWRLLQASDFDVPQLRPRFVLVALRPEDWPFFSWPAPQPTAETVGSALKEQMSAGGWRHAEEWGRLANRIAPTIVGGSKKHGGADLGPTRAKAAWRELSVDGLGLADAPPGADALPPAVKAPRLTVEMVARLQGWEENDPRHQEWLANLAGGKTARYRQIGNAFPPPVARAVGQAIISALQHKGEGLSVAPRQDLHDGIYRVLSNSKRFLTSERILALAGERLDREGFEKRMAHLAEDFVIEVRKTQSGPAYRISDFKAFTGQAGHARHEYLRSSRSRVS
ncbi:DNA cytosine methyltransferase [Oryzobacter sp. R7]|uniref:DNA cytosine methyltransferase n=1 Tax=Oryzobacter faecalis TaxID=3388656 RepID=UPI00398D423B